jgi:hypothetical protein
MRGAFPDRLDPLSSLIPIWDRLSASDDHDRGDTLLAYRGLASSSNVDV